MAVHAYAPAGQTPILKVPLTRDHLSAIGAITLEGKMCMQTQDHSYKGPDVARFLQLLLREIPGKLLVIWDGASIRRSQPIKDFLTKGGAKRIHLERLPSYAPQINPQEGVWNLLKRVDARGRNFAGRDMGELLERCLARSIAAPAGVGLDPCVTGYVDNACAGVQVVSNSLHKCKRRDHISAVDTFEHIERIIEQVWLRTGAEHARVIYESVQAASALRRFSKSLAMSCVCHITGNGNNPGQFCQVSARSFKRIRTASINDECPVAPCEFTSERQAEAARSACNQGGTICSCRHVCSPSIPWSSVSL